MDQAMNGSSSEVYDLSGNPPPQVEACCFNDDNEKDKHHETEIDQPEKALIT